MGDYKDNVKVAIRIRPLNEKERQEGGKSGVSMQEPFKVLAVDVKSDKKCFKFDYIASEEISQDHIFETIGKPIASSCLSGYNGTIFAYGQTGAGKTFTILGHHIENAEVLSPDYSNRGLLPRCFEYLFNAIDEETSQSDTKYLIKCSYLEIYQDQVNDLLNPSPQNLQLREDMRRGVYVDGLIEETVNSVSETYNILKIGTQNRHVGCTSMNKESSRSHSVFTLMIESKDVKDGVTNFRTSRFHLIDLAGSERQKATDSAGERLKEAGMINKSLSALGNVINSLVDISEGKSRHVHYRDSKLTFLLKDSLGGNSKTYIVANISPSASAISETLSTLKFAQRAKQIKNSAVVNEDTSGAISMLRYEVKRLKDELSIAKEQTTCTKCNKILTCTAENNEFIGILEKTLRLKQEDTYSYTRQITDKDSYINGLQSTIAKLENKISHDKMILKFRDATISSLQNNSNDEESEIGNLKKELKLVKEELESNPKAAKLFVENERLNGELLEWKKEEKRGKGLELEEINCKLAENLARVVEEKDEITEDLMRISEKYKAVKGKRNELMANVEALQEKITDLEIANIVDKQMSEKSSVFEEIDEENIELALKSIGEQQRELQTGYLEKVKYEEIVSEMTGKVKGFEEKVQQKNEEIQGMSEDIVYLTGQCQEALSEVEKVIKENKELQESYQKLSELNKELQRNYENISEKYQEIQGNYEKVSENYEKVSEIHGKVSENYKELQENYEESQKKEKLLQEYLEKIQIVESENERLIGIIQEQERGLEDREMLTERCDSLKEEIQEFKETNKILTDEQAKSHSFLRAIQEKHEETIAKLQTANEDLTSDLYDYQQNEANLIEKVEYYREEYLKISKDFEDSKNETEEITTKLQIEKEKSEELMESLENLKLEFAKNKHEQNNKYIEAVQEIKHLEMELNKEKKANSQRIDLESRVKTLTEELKVAKNSADSFQELNLMLTQKNAEISNSLSKIHSSHVPIYIVDQLRASLSEAQLEAAALKEENRQKIEILKSTKSQITSTKTEITAWKRCIDEKNTMISELKGELARLEEGEISEETVFLRNALTLKDRELKELKEKGQEYYSQADEVLENMRKKCMSLQNEVSNLRDELKNNSRNSGNEKRHRSALRENIEFSNRGPGKPSEEVGVVKAMNHRLTDELKKNVEVIEILQKRHLDMNKRLSELSMYKSQYEEEIEKLTEGLTKITDFVFNLPSVKIAPEEDSIINSTIKAISQLYEGGKERKKYYN